ncbi:polygalacturonase [Granulicella rosea]|uniref:Polygalacturonase n=1 Tax=Granulicella rosea TaxID=474952 RepID=A0A239E018_9BACT|nr:glycosyl hydrolase family 28 protein [Granulicella rosea]SNS38060.1 polygalacturonase [Granulicella rosea]
MQRTIKTALGCSVVSCFLTLGAAAQTYATGDSRTVGTPSYPAVCQTLTAQFSTSQRSSPPTSDDTSRLQTALNACAGTGKSVVLASSGSDNAFYSDKLTVNGEGLVVDSGVTLEGNNSYSSQSELIYIEGTNSFLGGTGAIDGRGDLSAISGTPRLVQTNSANNFIAYQITLQQAAHPNLYIQGGNGATVYGVTILTPATRANADGIDIDSIANVSVINSSIEAGDDGIAVKTNASAASNITVKGTKLYGTHGLSIGSQTFDGVTNVLFTGNYVYGNDHSGTASGDANAINIKTDSECGGLVKQVTYQNTCITNAKHLIVVNAAYGSCSGTSGTPQFQDILVNGVKSVSSISGAYTELAGYNSSNLAQVYLANISLDVTTQSGDKDATVYLDNSNITPSGTGVTTSTFTTSGSVPTCSF